MNISRSSVLTAIVVFGILYSNILRFFPFPSGRSLNDLITLTDNLPNIVVNFLIYTSLLCFLWNAKRPSRSLFRHSFLLYGYSIFILLQSFFRPDPFMEMMRGGAAIVMFLSADRLGKYLGSDVNRLDAVMQKIWISLIGSLFVGIVIGVLIPDSVNWGGGLSPSYAQQDRAEFFFFYLSPAMTFALSLFMIKRQHGHRGLVYYSAALSMLVVLILAIRTQGRGLEVSLLLATLVFLYSYYRRRFALVVVVGALVSFASSGYWVEYLEYLEKGRLVSQDPRADLSTGRLALYGVLYEKFLESPVFGQGAQEARQVIDVAGTFAKTEHGYIMHLASYGLFAVLFYGYIVYGLVASIGMILGRGANSSSSALIGRLSCVAASLVTVWSFLGFVGIFGSATAFYDWFAIFWVSLAFSLWRKHYAGRAFSHCGKKSPFRFFLGRVGVA